MERKRTATRMLGGVAATLALVLAATVAPAEAAPSDKDRVTSTKRDTGWDAP